jgi:hypothetical protein
MEQSEQEQQDSIKRMRDERAVECNEDESEKARCEINRNDVVAGYPLVYYTKSMYSHDGERRIGVRQASENNFLVVWDHKSHKSFADSSEFTIRSVERESFSCLPSAIAYAENSRRDWQDCANEDRMAAMEAMEDDLEDERRSYYEFLASDDDL